MSFLTLKEGESTLLDNTMAYFGSGIRDGDAHDNRNLPVLVAGRGGGAFATGRHIS